MALIGTIRKNFWFVLLLLGLALAAFILMDMMSAGQQGGGPMTLGKINGEKIDYREFQTTENVLYSNAGGDVYQRRNALWDYFVEKKIVEQASNKLGLGVSRDELMDLQFGQNLSPIMRQNWTNPQTGQLDMAQLLQYKQSIENEEELAPQFRSFWAEQEKQIIKTELQQKINNMVSKAVYTPAWMAETVHQEQNSTMDLAFVKIPYDAIDASSVEVTDADYQNYLNGHANQFTNDEEVRALEYFTFNVLPTSEDSAVWRNQMVERADAFRTAPNDSLFALQNKGVYNNFYYKPDQLTEGMRDIIPSMSVGEVRGPYIEGNNYRLLKMIDSKVLPDTVSARHILRTATVGNEASFVAAENYIDSLRSRLNRGQESFDSLAIKNSQDPASASRGGQLDDFVQGTMVPQFNETCFVTGKSGNYYSVRTNIGVHLIHVQNQKFADRDPEYKIAFVDMPIVPTEDTQDRIYEEVAELISAHPYLDDMRNTLSSRADIDIQTQQNMKQNDFQIGSLGGGNTTRDIIRWAFTGSTSVNDVAPEVYTYTDNINYFNSKYVIVGLNNIAQPGMRSVASAKDEIAALVLNQKKGAYLVNQLGATTDLNSLASQYSVSVDTSRNLSVSSTFAAGLQNETAVIGKAFETPINSGATVAGDGGVYVVMPLSKNEAGAPSNVPLLRTNDANNARTAISTGLMSSLKKAAKVSDNRFTFF